MNLSPRHVPPQRVLILFPRQLGDVILATNMAFALKYFFPQVEIGWCAHSMCAQILEGNTAIEKRFYLPKNKRPKGIFKKVSFFLTQFMQEVRLLNELHQFKPDAVIVPMSNLRTIIQLVASGSRIRIGVNGDVFRNIFFQHIISRQELSNEYLAWGLLKFLHPLGIERASLPIQLQNLSALPLTEKQYETVNTWLTSANLTQTKFVLLSPTHRHPVRQWPKKHFIALAAQLMQKKCFPVVWLWGPGELEFVSEFAKELKDEFGIDSHIPPLFSLCETACLAKLCALWVGNSNGLSHVAVAGGARTVQIHGPTNGTAWTHPDKTRHRIAQRSTGCVACHHNHCSLPRQECMEDLSVDQVFSLVEAIQMC